MIVDEKDYEHLTLLEKARAWRRAVFATYREGQPKNRLLKFLDEVELALGAADKVSCAKLRGDAQTAAERACQQPYTFTDNVPYCDACGLFRASVRHRS